MAKHVSRRSVLTAGAAGIASTLVSLPGAVTYQRPGPKAEVKNIIFCVSDGMSAGVPSMLHHFLDSVHGKHSVWHELARDKGAVNGFMDTRSLNSMVTDSAAAASSWGSGCLVLNGALNTLPGLPELTPLYDLLGKDGMQRGLVTTATITHATPAGFAVAVRSRGDQPAIARQYRERGVELLMGGGHEFFASDLRSDKVDVYDEYARDGYAVIRTRDELLAVKGNRILGVFGRGQLPFTVDRNHQSAIAKVIPTLAEMTNVAIDALKAGPNGFVLQVEGARIDHAAHPNDLAGLIFDQWAFEDALKVALDFARQDGETLVVVTSDHGNANPGITGNAQFGEGNGLALLQGMTSSYEAMVTDFRAATTSAAVKTLIEARLGLKFTDAEAQAVADSAGGRSPVAPFGNYRYPSATLAMAIGSYTGVGWTSGSHTSDWTKITAIGPGAEHFGGLVQNTEVFGKLLALRGLQFVNPKLTLEEAQANAAKARQARHPDDEIHWA